MSQVLKLIGVMLIGIILVAASCSGDEKSEDSTSLLEQVGPLYKVRAENVLLTLADLPSNWTSTPYEDLYISVDFSDQCAMLGEDNDTDSSYTANSSDFSGSNGDSAHNSIDIVSLGLEDAALLNELDLALDRCWMK